MSGRYQAGSNLFGEHTDDNAGLCLAIALPQRTFVAARRRQDRLLIEGSCPERDLAVQTPCGQGARGGRMTGGGFGGSANALVTAGAVEQVSSGVSLPSHTMVLGRRTATR